MWYWWYLTLTAGDPPLPPPFASGGQNEEFLILLRTTLPRITRYTPFPPVSSRGAKSCREPVSLPISTTEETHETHDIGLGLWSLSDLCIMRGVQVPYIEM
jgi:hypothetical protein